MFENGLILGRSRALWVSAITAIVNALELLGVLNMTPDQVAAVDLALVALIGLISNADDPRTVPTFALTTSAPSQAENPPASLPTNPVSSPTTDTADATTPTSTTSS